MKASDCSYIYSFLASDRSIWRKDPRSHLCGVRGVARRVPHEDPAASRHRYLVGRARWHGPSSQPANDRAGRRFVHDDLARGLVELGHDVSDHVMAAMTRRCRKASASWMSPRARRGPAPLQQQRVLHVDWAATWRTWSWVSTCHIAASSAWRPRNTAGWDARTGSSSPNSAAYEHGRRVPTVSTRRGDLLRQGESSSVSQVVVGSGR